MSRNIGSYIKPWAVNRGIRHVPVHFRAQISTVDAKEQRCLMFSNALKIMKIK